MNTLTQGYYSILFLLFISFLLICVIFKMIDYLAANDYITPFFISNADFNDIKK